LRGCDGCAEGDCSANQDLNEGMGHPLFFSGRLLGRGILTESDC
jgi:hypothetical protein